MSLDCGILTHISEDAETALEISGKVFRFGTLPSCDWILSETEARLIHCEIKADSFGRVTVTNYSKRNPVLLNGNALNGTRPLFTGSVLEMFHSKFRWINRDRHPHTPSNRQRIIQRPYSAGGALNDTKASQRSTMYCLEMPRMIAPELKDSKIEDRHSRKSISAALKTVGATPPRVVKTPKRCTPHTEEDKENSLQQVEDKNLILLKCHSSAMVVTSYSPNATPTRTPKSFALITSTKNTPNSVYKTPRSVLLETNASPKTPESIDACSMHLIDFTTPSVYRTPLQRKTPLIRSALKNSTTKSATKRAPNSPLINKTMTPTSNKKIRWETPTSDGKPVKKHDCSIPRKSSTTTPSSSTKKPLNVSKFAATTTPISLTKQFERIEKTSSSATKNSPVSVKSLNRSNRTPVKTPKTSFTVSADKADKTPMRIPIRKFDPKSPDSTIGCDSAIKTAADRSSINPESKGLERSGTFIVETSATFVMENLKMDEDSDSKSNSTFTLGDDNDEESIEIPETQDPGLTEGHSIRNEETETSRRSTYEQLSTSLSVSIVDIEPNDAEQVIDIAMDEDEEHFSCEDDPSTSQRKSLEKSRQNESLQKLVSTELEEEAEESVTFSKRRFEKSSSILSDDSFEISETPQRKSFRGRKFAVSDILLESIEEGNLIVEDNSMTPVRKSLRKSLKSPDTLLNVSQSGTQLQESLIDHEKSMVDSSAKTSDASNSFRDGQSKESSSATTPPPQRQSFRGQNKEITDKQEKDGQNLDRSRVQPSPKTPRFCGIKELLQSPKSPEELNLIGLKELVRSPKDLKTPRDFIGVKELLKTPNLESPQLKGVREMLKTPRIKSPQLKGVREMLKTPRLKSPRLPSYDDMPEDLQDVFKTPSSRTVMVLTTPKSVLIEKRANSVADLMRTPEQVDLHEEMGKMDSLFKSPLADIPESSRIENDNEKSLTADETFDKLIGKPIIRRTYERSPVKSKILPLLIQESIADQAAKTDIQEWVDKVNKSVSDDEEKSKAANSLESASSPAVDTYRKPLAASSTIKPVVRRSMRQRQLSLDQQLNEMSGIDRLDDSTCSMANQSCIACDTTPRTPRKSLATPTKINTSASRRAIKVTPQIRRLRGKNGSPYSNRKANGDGPFADMSIQFIDESTTVNIGSTIKTITDVEGSRYESFEAISVLDSIVESKDDRSEETILVSDEEEILNEIKKIEESRNNTVEFVAINELTSRSEKNIATPASDIFKNIRGVVSEMDAIDETNETSFANSTVVTIGSTIAENEDQESAEEALLQQYELEASIEADVTRASIEAVYLKTSGSETPRGEISRGSVIDVNSSIENSNSNGTLWKSVIDQESPLDPIGVHDEFANFQPVPSLRQQRYSHALTPPVKQQHEPSKIRRTVGKPPFSTSFDLEAEQRRHEIESEFKNFESDREIVKRGRTLTPVDDTTSKSSLTRRTMGNKTEVCFDLIAEQKRHEIESELKNLDADREIVKRGRTLIAVRSVNAGKSSLTRRSLGDNADSSFDLGAEQRRYEIESEFKNFESGGEIVKRGRTLTPVKGANAGKGSMTRRTLGDNTEGSFDLKAEQIEAEFKNFESGREIVKRGRTLTPVKNDNAGKSSLTRRTLGDNTEGSFDWVEAKMSVVRPSQEPVNTDNDVQLIHIDENESPNKKRCVLVEESKEVSIKEISITDDDHIDPNSSRHVHFGRIEVFNITGVESKNAEELTINKTNNKTISATPAKPRAGRRGRHPQPTLDENQITVELNHQDAIMPEISSEPADEVGAKKRGRRGRKPQVPTERVSENETEHGLEVTPLLENVKKEITTAEVDTKRTGRRGRKPQAAATESEVIQVSKGIENETPTTETSTKIVGRRGRKCQDSTGAEVEIKHEDKETPLPGMVENETPTVEIDTKRIGRRGRKPPESAVRIIELKEEEEVLATPVPKVMDNNETPQIEDGPKKRGRGRPATKAQKTNNGILKPADDVIQENFPAAEEKKPLRRARKPTGKRDTEEIDATESEVIPVSKCIENETPTTETGTKIVGRRGRKLQDSTEKEVEIKHEDKGTPLPEVVEYETPTVEIGTKRVGRRGRKPPESVVRVIEPEEEEEVLATPVPKVMDNNETPQIEDGPKKRGRGRPATKVQKTNNDILKPADEVIQEEFPAAEEKKPFRRARKPAGKQDIEEIDATESEVIPVSKGIESETPTTETSTKIARGRERKLQDSTEAEVEIKHGDKGTPLPGVVENETPTVEIGTKRVGRRGRKPSESVVRIIEPEEEEEVSATPVPKVMDNNESPQIEDGPKKRGRGRLATKAQKTSNEILKPADDVIQEGFSAAEENKPLRRVRKPAGKQNIEEIDEKTEQSAADKMITKKKERQPKTATNKPDENSESTESQAIGISPREDVTMVSKVDTKKVGRKAAASDRQPLVESNDQIEEPENTIPAKKARTTRTKQLQQSDTAEQVSTPLRRGRSAKK